MSVYRVSVEDLEGERHELEVEADSAEQAERSASEGLQSGGSVVDVEELGQA